MSLIGEIRNKLAATTAITSLVPAARIMQERRPQGQESPAIVVEFTDAEHEHDLDGAAGIRDTYINVSAWARNVGDRDSIAEQIRLALHGFSGTLTTLRTDGILVDDNTAFFEPDVTGAQNGWFRQVYRFKVMGSETIPS